MQSIQSKIECSIYKNNIQRIKELSTIEAPDFYTICFAVNRAMKYSNEKTRESLLLVLSYANLNQKQKDQIKEMSYSAPIKVQNILKLI